jgi:hypothetical protein
MRVSGTMRGDCGVCLLIPILNHSIIELVNGVESIKLDEFIAKRWLVLLKILCLEAKRRDYSQDV